jgi:hypothetical protein
MWEKAVIWRSASFPGSWWPLALARRFPIATSSIPVPELGCERLSAARVRLGGWITRREAIFDEDVLPAWTRRLAMRRLTLTVILTSMTG